MIDLVKFIEYNTWANKRIADLVLTLPTESISKETGGSFPSIRQTILHLLGADWIWMNRLNGRPIIDIPSEWVLDTSLAIVTKWINLQAELETVVKKSAAMPGTPIKFVTRKGVAHTLSVSDIVTQVVNHGTYHRGQIVNMVRALGFEPVNTDYFIYCTTMQSAEKR